MQLNVSLHPKQLEVFNHPARFKVVAAGRRFGKSRLAAYLLLIWALKNQRPDEWIFYVAPTFQQAKDVMWSVLKEIGGELITHVHENTGVLTLVNGARIALKGSDRPDTLRGVGLAGCVIDEYADMKASVFEQIIRPALARAKAPCFFIGTPKGRNHFYDLHNYASETDDEDWAAFEYTSYDNPFIDPKEIDDARKSMSSFAFRQEFLASFEAAASELFKQEWIKISSEEPADGNYFIAVDLAGFTDVAKESKNKKSRLDQSAIAIVKVHHRGWWVKEIQVGRWDIRECATRILKAARSVRAARVGIEKGALKNAVMPYLKDLQQRVGFYCSIMALTHGNKAKTERIVWALQGRMEHGRITLNEGEWVKDFVDQLLQCPDPKSHDDMIDALAYIDQMATTPLDREDDEDTFEIYDEVAGY